METVRHRRLCYDAILLAHLTGHYLSATRETMGAPYRALIGCAAAHSESNVLVVGSHTGHETCSASPQMESEMEKREKYIPGIISSGEAFATAQRKLRAGWLPYGQTTIDLTTGRQMFQLSAIYHY